jgi:cytochrome bd-type quinol oxidase subunit 1
MRRFLAVLVLGAVIPLAAVSAGWAGDKVDPQPNVFAQTSQPAATADTASSTGSAVVAGQGSGEYFGPYFEQRLDNMGQ